MTFEKNMDRQLNWQDAC